MPSTVGAPLRLGVIIAYRLDNRPSYADLLPTAHTLRGGRGVGGSWEGSAKHSIRIDPHGRLS